MEQFLGKQIVEINKTKEFFTGGPETGGGTRKRDTSKETLKIVVDDGLTLEITGNLTYSVKESQECHYCNEYSDKLRPTPFMADICIGAMMCEHCWNMTREAYINSTGEDIGKFEDYPHFEKESEKV